MPATILRDANSDEIKQLLTGKKIAIFSATLNPPTVAHDEMIDRLLAQKNDAGAPKYDFVYIHTTENSPTGHYKADTGSYLDRHAMTRLAFQGKDRVLLSDIMPLETVSLLMQTPDMAVDHIIGADSLAWLQGASDRGEAIFFKGTLGHRPTATVQHPETGEACLFSGRGIYEVRTSRVVIVQRAYADIPDMFLGVPTERFSLESNVTNVFPVSSTTIRDLMKKGSVVEATQMVAPGLRAVFFGKYAQLYR